MSKSTEIFKLTSKESQKAFDNLSRHYRIIAPIKKCGEGSLSDTDLVKYDEVKSFDEIEFFTQTFFSAKEFLFPVRETMFTFRDNKTQKISEDIPSTIIFLRSCDIHAIAVTDIHFLNDSTREDPYYKKRRNNVKIFLIECCESFENCYCVSLGTNETDDYSAFVRKIKDGYEVQVKDKDLEEYFPFEKGEGKSPKFPQKNMRAVDIPGDIDVSLFKDDMWKEYSQRCIACGRCNTSCPTCTCFTVKDIPSEKGDEIDRKRIWASCHVKKFSLLAGGHDFRTEYSDRMRYRTMHKMRDFKRKNGRQMCIGCGRCDDVCPVYISMFRCVGKIKEVIKKRQENNE